ncbi:hypothetical protein ACFYUY_04140 [Kitasatospora sp. NPDC004745]|uniref:hypothetical protein n=1 Tax=Kitasatospora sp. NPDC004745 TaxID=3364019 RepID=UPI0036A7FA0A
MRAVVPLLDGAVLLSTGAALALAPRAWRREVPPGRGSREVPPGRGSREVPPGRGGRFGPEAALAVVVGLILLNQALFTVYVRRVHDGSAAFVARHLPPGWFDLAGPNALLDRLAAHFPAPELLAPTVLRVQALLELPLVLLAFAAVLRRLDRGLYVRVARSPLVPFAAASYTVAFCAVEWDLHNPYTVDDIALRIVSALVTPPLLARIAGREPPADRPPRSPVLFVVDLWLYGHLMLVLYDTVLLYNLGRLGGHLPGALAAVAALAVTAALPRSAQEPGPRVAALTATTGRALALFLVPALAIRYGASFGTPRLAAAAGLLVAAAALRRESLRLLPAAAAGLAVGCAVAALLPGPYFEATLLRSATGALLAASALCELLDTTRSRLDVLP